MIIFITMLFSLNLHAQDPHLHRLSTPAYYEQAFGLLESKSAPGQNSWPVNVLSIGHTNASYQNYGSGYGRIRFYQSNSNHSTIHSFSSSWQSGSLAGHSTGAINIAGSNGVTFGDWDNVDMWIDRAGNAQARGSLRAPIFYDSEDTGYYVDPDSVSKLSLLGLGGAAADVALSVSGDSHISGYIYQGGAGGSVNSWGSRTLVSSGNYVSNANSFRFDNVGFGSTWSFVIDSGGAATASASLRAPIFYDSQDTTYYLDPNSTGSSLVVAGYTKSKFTYRNNPAAGLPGQDYPVKTATGVLATLSSAGYGNEYIIIKTRVPQDSYQMGGFTIDLFARYNDSNAKTTISLGGYWNPESNGGFAGWEYNTTNPNVRPGIFVMRDVTDGSTCFAIQISKSYPIVVARDLYLGHDSSDIEGWLDWSIFGADDLGGYTNNDEVVCRNAMPVDNWYGNSYIGYNGAHYGTIFYDASDTSYYVDPNSESKLKKLWINNGGASGVPWSSGLNMGDGSNYWNLIQDAGTARQRNYGTGGYDWYNSTASTQIMYLSNAGNVTFSGDVTAYSDARVKENVHTIENALDKTLQLRGVTYNRTDSEDKSTKVGVIAQEILEVIPEVVKQNDEGMYSVSYGNLTAVLIEAIKEQQKQIDELKEIINGLTK